MSYNSTGAAFFEAYTGTDFSSISWLEHQWVAWYVWIGNPVVATGLMSFLLHEVLLLVCFGISTHPFVRLSILDVVFHGSLLTLFLTSASGNFKPTRFLLLKNSGLAQSRSCILISQLNFLLWVRQVALSKPHLQHLLLRFGCSILRLNHLACKHIMFHSRRWKPWLLKFSFSFSLKTFSTSAVCFLFFFQFIR